jgi:hypothetical protein
MEIEHYHLPLPACGERAGVRGLVIAPDHMLTLTLPLILSLSPQAGRRDARRVLCETP